MSDVYATAQRAGAGSTGAWKGGADGPNTAGLSNVALSRLLGGRQPAGVPLICGPGGATAAIEAEYNRAQVDLAELMAKPELVLRDFRPDLLVDEYEQETALGYFDAVYRPAEAVLEIQVRCSFRMERTLFEWLMGTERSLDSLAMYKQQYLAWAPAPLNQAAPMLACRRPFWEALRVRPRYVVIEDDQDPHFLVHLQSNIIRPSVTGPQWDLRTRQVKPGEVWLAYQNLDPDPTAESGQPKSGAGGHEFGHQVGNLDVYHSPAREHRPDEKRAYEAAYAQHNQMVQAETGHGLALGNDDRLMSTGRRVVDENYVSAVLALQKLTGCDWVVGEPAGTGTPPPTDQSRPQVPLATAGESAPEQSGVSL